MDSEQKEVIAEESGKTLILTINNPERNNVMTRGIRNSIWQILRENEENNLKTVIFKGAGKNFSAGADIKNLLSLEGDLADEYTTFVREFLIYVQNYPKITIGVVNGFSHKPNPHKLHRLQFLFFSLCILNRVPSAPFHCILRQSGLMGY